jgi:nucleoside-diphosphate-sugar epimerase
VKSRTTSIALRAVADAALALGSLAAGLGIRLLAKSFETPGGSPGTSAGEFLRFFESYAPLLAVSVLAAFSIFHVYTRNRLYVRRQKLVNLAQATSLAYIVFVSVVYLFKLPAGYIPRGALFIAYAITLAGACGGRLLMEYLDKIFILESARPASERSIRKVLVVGGAGYIGCGLVRDLLAEGYRVRVLDVLLYGDEAIRDLYHHPSFELVQGDFREVSPVVKAVKGVDAVIHLGAIVGDPACAISEDETLETNLAATRLLADVCRASSVSRVLFASTCSVYGAAQEVVDEKSELNPVSLYAATKIDSERVLLDAQGRDFHPVIMRLATAFGWSHRPRFDLVVNLLTAKAAQEKKIVIFNGEQWRPFIHVRDISAAFRAALRAPLELVSGEVFNVGSDSMNLTLTELAAKIQEIEPGLEVEHITNSDARTYRVCFDKIQERLGFTCQVSVEDGVTEIRQHLLAGAVSDYRDATYSNVQLVKQLQLIEKHKPEAIELTALRFTQNGKWIKTAIQGTSRW